MNEIETTTYTIAEQFVTACDEAGIPYPKQRDMWVAALMRAREQYWQKGEKHDLRC